VSKTTAETPYTEIVERVMSLGRVNANAIEKVRGIVQDIYTRDIPTKHDWNFLFVSSAITTVGQYNTGTVSATTGSNILTFSSDVVLIDSMNGRKVKLAGNQVTYEIDSIGTSVVRIAPVFLGENNITAGSYTIFQPTYALAADFDRFPKDGGIYKWSGQAKERLPETPYQEYVENYASQPSNPDAVRIVGQDTAGNTLVEFIPAPKDARVYSYDYLMRLQPLQETSTNLVRGVSSKAVTVALLGTTQYTEITTDSKTVNFFRVDALGKGQDSQWYPVLSYQGDSSHTLRTVFAASAITSSANYTISQVPKMPTMLHPAIMYGTLAHIMADQNDPNAALYLGRYAQVLSDAKRIFVTRTYSQDIHGIQEEWEYRR
jgi:hypothetical protein